jgi:hypothetical protein
MAVTTSWRQGHLLTRESTAELVLKCPLEGTVVAVVASHDCDIANDKELTVEVIVGVLLEKCDKQFLRARNVRELHYRVPATFGEGHFIALRHEHLVRVPRAQFLTSARRDDRYEIDPDEKRALKQWLAARYGRPAFPDRFEAHLRKEVRKRKVERAITDLVSDEESLLVGIFFDLGDYRSEDPPTGEPFILRIYVVYDASGSIGTTARPYAEDVARRLEALFLEAYGSSEDATEIALEKCTAVADLSFTLADIRRSDQWRLEHVSLRQDPPTDFLAAGGSVV